MCFFARFIKSSFKINSNDSWSIEQLIIPHSVTLTHLSSVSLALPVFYYANTRVIIAFVYHGNCHGRPAKAPDQEAIEESQYSYKNKKDNLIYMHYKRT